MVYIIGSYQGLFAMTTAKLFKSGRSQAVRLPKVPHTEDRVHHFVSCVLDGKKPLVPLEESLQVQRVLDAIYTSSATGKEVKLN